MLRKQVDGLALVGMNDAVLQMWSREMKIMQIKKLSKLISQLHSLELVPSGPRKPGLRTTAKQRSLSVSTDDGKQDWDWGSDFEEQPSTPPSQRNSLLTKISSNQIPRPYKAGDCPDYSNIRVIADADQPLSPAPSRANKLDQSNESRSSVNYSVVRKTDDSASQLRKPCYTSLQYSTIDHTKTIKARNKSSSVNPTSSVGPKIAGPKPLLSLEEIQGRRSSPVLLTGSRSVPDKGDGKEELDEDYEIPETGHRLLLTEEANNNVRAPRETCEDNEYEPIQSPDTWQLPDPDKGENNSCKSGEKSSIVTTPVISSMSSKFSDRSLPPPPTVAGSSSSSVPWSEVSQYPWYHDTDRTTAHLLLKQLNSDGGFLVRSSKHGGPDSPFTLSVYNQGRVFNINIRTRQDGLLALGKEKADENTYSSVGEMIENHRTEALKLTSGAPRVSSESNTTLNCWPIKH